jgi:hypothetical protein
VIFITAISHHVGSRVQPLLGARSHIGFNESYGLWQIVVARIEEMEFSAIPHLTYASLYYSTCFQVLDDLDIAGRYLQG